MNELFWRRQQEGQQQYDAALQRTWPNPFSRAPQAPNEPMWYNALRNVISTPVPDAVKNVFDWNYQRDIGQPFARAIVQALDYAGDTPELKQKRVAQQQRVQATAQPQNAFKPQPGTANGTPGNSYKDPRWGDLEAVAEQKYGLPPGLLASIRLKGERSNGDQVSPVGARTVYQIMPETAAGLKKNYGINAYGSPQEQAMGAAALLAENLKRTGNVRSAVQQYHGGLNPANYGPQNRAYLDRVFGDGASSAFVNPFDPSYFQAAANQLDAAGAAAKKPVEVTFNPGPSPEMPNAADFVPPPTDFSKVDAAVEKLKPAEIAETQKLQTRRSEWFAGIGQALMSLPEGAGLGKVLAAVGGGAAMGSARGDDKVRADMERFDQKMAQYNVAVLNNEQNKAQTLAAEAARRAQMLYSGAMKKYEVQLNEYYKFNDVSMDGKGNTVVRSRDPQTGMVSQKFIPNAHAVDAATAQGKADIFLRAGGEANAGRRMVATAQNGLIANTMVQQAQQGSNTQDSLLAMPAFVGASVIDSGLAEQLFSSPDVYAGVQAEAKRRAMAALGQTGAQPDKDGKPPNLFAMEADAKFQTSGAFQEAYKRAMVGLIQEEAITNQKFRQRLFEVGGNAVQVQEGIAMGNRRQTSRTNAKGQTTTTTSMDYDN